MARGNYKIMSPDLISITKQLQVTKILSNHKQNLINVIEDNKKYIDIIKQELNPTQNEKILLTPTEKEKILLTICDEVLGINPAKFKPVSFIDYDSLVQLIELFNDDRTPKFTNKIMRFFSKKTRNSLKLFKLVKKTSRKTKKSHTPVSELMNTMRTMTSGVDSECLTLLDEIKEIDSFKGYNFKCLSVDALKKLIITPIEEQIVMTEMLLANKAEEAEKKRWRAILAQLQARLEKLRK